MNIIAKMVCQSMQKSEEAETIILQAVYDDGCEENKSFSEATPSASVNMTISNKAAFGAFVEGQKYYVNFSPATT